MGRDFLGTTSRGIPKFPKIFPEYFPSIGFLTQFVRKCWVERKGFQDLPRSLHPSVLLCRRKQEAIERPSLPFFAEKEKKNRPRKLS